MPGSEGSPACKAVASNGDHQIGTPNIRRICLEFWSFDIRICFGFVKLKSLPEARIFLPFPD
jgi:hypothetical protein